MWLTSLSKKFGTSPRNNKMQQSTEDIYMAPPIAMIPSEPIPEHQTLVEPRSYCISVNGHGRKQCPVYQCPFQTNIPQSMREHF
jgi:hypothetical protein